MQRRPNFLLVMTDQQRADNYGFVGHPMVQTPHIDALASTGSWWSNFYTASPSCMSNRASLLTGRMPSLHGVRYNGIPLDRDAVTFVDLLREDGYRTALVGKSHLQCQSHVPSFVPRNPSEGRSPAAGLDEARRSRYSAGDYRSEQIRFWKEHPDAARKTPLPFYGFDSVSFCLGHGDVVTGHYEDWLREKGHEVENGPDLAQVMSETGAPQLYKPAVPTELYPTTYVAEETGRMLEAFAGSGEPFFVQCSFPDPHHPFTPPGEFWDMFDPADIDLPTTFERPGDDAIPPLAYLWDEFEAGRESKRWSHPFVTGEQQAREIIARNYGQIALIDSAIGQVLAKLDELGLADNTVVCFVADHGEYLGDHGLFLKGPFQYLSLIRTPFVWRDPDPAHNLGRRDALASSVDLASTVLGRAGLQPFNGVQGVDLLDDTLEQRDRVLIEHTNQFVYLGFDDIVSVHSYVDSEWRLSVWQGCDWGELYNLRDDPDETVNLWSNAPHQSLKSELILRLVHAIQDHADTSPHPMAVS